MNTVKKTTAAVFSLALCLVCASCSSDGAKYSAAKSAQESVTSVKSGEIKITSTMTTDKKIETVNSSFLFTHDSSDKLNFCHTQQDKSGKTVFCELLIGDTAEQWLIGRGWSVAEPKSNPSNRFIALMSNTPERRAVSQITSEETAENTVITLTLIPEVLNETAYKAGDVKIISEVITLTLDKDGVLTCYNDAAQTESRDGGKQRGYNLNMELSRQNEEISLVKPELREYAPSKAE